MYISIEQATVLLNELLSKPESITIESISDIISQLSVVDNTAPEGATTHFFTGEPENFSIPGGDASLGLIDRDTIRLLNHTYVQLLPCPRCVRYARLAKMIPKSLAYLGQCKICTVY